MKEHSRFGAADSGFSLKIFVELSNFAKALARHQLQLTFKPISFEVLET